MKAIVCFRVTVIEFIEEHKALWYFITVLWLFDLLTRPRVCFIWWALTAAENTSKAERECHSALTGVSSLMHKQMSGYNSIKMCKEKKKGELVIRRRKKTWATIWIVWDEKRYVRISRDVTSLCRAPSKKNSTISQSETSTWLTFEQQNLKNHHFGHMRTLFHLNNVYLFRAWQLYTTGSNLTA